MTTVPTLLLADPSPLFRGALRSLISDAGFAGAIEEFGRMDDLVKFLSKRPLIALVVLDSRLPGLHSYAQLEQTISVAQLPLLVTTDQVDAQLCAGFMTAGASGVISKCEPIDVLEQAMLTLLEGGIWLPRSREVAAASPLDLGLSALSRRERDVLGLLEQGLKNRQISDRMGISLATVKRHATNIYRKLGVESRILLVLALREQGRGSAIRSAA